MKSSITPLPSTCNSASQPDSSQLAKPCLKGDQEKQPSLYRSLKGSGSVSGESAPTEVVSVFQRQNKNNLPDGLNSSGSLQGKSESDPCPIDIPARFVVAPA